MILIALGGNIPHPRFASIRETCEAALTALETRGVRVQGRSRWYRSPPVPPSDQPDYVNGVARVLTELAPEGLLDLLHRVEGEFGRVRTVPNAPRVLDLDLIAYDEVVMAGGEGLRLPHPRMHLRAFVLLPLREVAPGWRHPILDRTVDELIAALPPDQDCSPLPET